MADGCLGLRPQLAGLDALVPCVLKLCVASTAAVSEPGTAATATTSFAGFIDGATFGAYGTGGRRFEFASLHALKPPVTNVSVAGTSTVPKPSTVRSAATDSAGFPELAALWTRHYTSDPWYDG